MDTTSRMAKEKNKDQLISRETAELVKKLGFDWPVDFYYPAKVIYKPDILSETGFPAATQTQVQKWLRETQNWNIVPVRVPNDTDSHDNHKIYLNGREWYCEGLYVVVSGYEECLEAGLQKSLRFLIQKNESYNQKLD